jgi:hypothetical protein
MVCYVKFQSTKPLDSGKILRLKMLRIETTRGRVGVVARRSAGTQLRKQQEARSSYRHCAGFFRRLCVFWGAVDSWTSQNQFTITMSPPWTFCYENHRSRKTRHAWQECEAGPFVSTQFPLWERIPKGLPSHRRFS